MRKYYTNPFFVFLIVFLFLNTISAQKNEDLWTTIKKEQISSTQKLARKTEPIKATFYKLDIIGLKALLQNAPKRKGFIGVSNVVISFPNTDGNLEQYRVLEASVMDPILQESHLNIRSYVGQNIKNPSTTIRFSVTPQGLHAMTLSSNKGTQFIDPHAKNDHSYILYAKQDLPRLEDEFICGVIDEISAKEDNNIDTVRNANDGKMREFRLALACTLEYSDYHVQAAGLGGGTEAEKKAAVLDAMVVTMTRVNGVFEKDLSLTMALIANNEDIIFIDEDPFTTPANNDGNLLISQSQTEIDTAIGDANYDIGHTFSTGGGGLAGLGIVCLSGNKARGVTGSNAPVGDAYDIDFVAHEMGHQFGANHTFNGDAGNCAGANRVDSNAYEPGSGSTIMAYAGICTPQNVQNNSDAYFHQASLQEIWANLTTGNSTCAVQTATGNSPPTAIAGSNYTIPISTPYKLTGSSTDTDGTSSHTFTWEQYDLGDAGLPTEGDLSGGSLVRSFEGTTDPVRYIPRLQDVLNNGGVSTTWEKLASVSRDINFQLTVRDNDITGGQTDSSAMTVTTVAATGAFTVTSQASSQLVLTQGANEIITWNVAGTTANGVNTANVNILLSSDNGVTFDRVLAANTPNDGTESIVVPNDITAPYCRIMVEAVGNIFYAVNPVFFAIGNYTYEPSDVCIDYVFNLNSSIPVITTPSISGVSLTVDDSVTISDVTINVDISHNNIGELDYGFGVPFQNGGVVNRLAFGSCNGSTDVDLTFDDEGAVVNCASTTNGDFVLPIDPLSIADGMDSAGDWIFWRRDTVDNGVSGTLNSVTLTICHSELVPTLDIDSFSLEDSFSVFPNPNNGEFTVKLNSNSGNDIRISVYDIRGRQVFDNSYNNAANFNEVINLGSVQSGLYILKITDGNKTGTKKIIIN
ncbi:MAG: T9SS type A sorting domain-containing protein [Bacteroidetes bacterium]|nr:T9SS type A sorting domain-containing protein [Bacteroidota bacterium]